MAATARPGGQHTLTVTATLTSLGTPLHGQRLTVTTGTATLCTTATQRNGTTSCVLTTTQSAALRHHHGRYTVSYTGTPGYYPATAHGHAITPPSRAGRPARGSPG